MCLFFNVNTSPMSLGEAFSNLLRSCGAYANFFSNAFMQSVRAFTSSIETAL